MASNAAILGLVDGAIDAGHGDIKTVLAILQQNLLGINSEQSARLALFDALTSKEAAMPFRHVTADVRPAYWNAGE